MMAAETDLFPKESMDLWKEQACKELTQYTQKLVIFTEYVHLYGRLTFDIDGKERVSLNLSEMISPCLFHDSTNTTEEPMVTSRGPNKPQTRKATTLVIKPPQKKPKETKKKQSKKSLKKTKRKARLKPQPTIEDADVNEEVEADADDVQPMEQETQCEVMKDVKQEAVSNYDDASAVQVQSGVLMRFAQELKEEGKTFDASHDAVLESQQEVGQTTDMEVQESTEPDLNIKENFLGAGDIADEAVTTGLYTDEYNAGEDVPVEVKAEEAKAEKSKPSKRQSVKDDDEDKDFEPDGATDVSEVDDDDEVEGTEETEEDDDDDDDDYKVNRKSSSFRQRKVVTIKEQSECCPKCPARFTTKYRLNKHIQNTHENQVECEHCSESFHKKAELKLHFRADHPDEEFPFKFTCQVCLDLFQTKDELLQHTQKSHLRTCDYCSETFTRPSELSKHIKVKHANDPAVCNICQREFSSVKNMRNHKRATHENRDKEKVQCNECGKVCLNAYALYLHERGVHKKSEFYPCDICGKKFTYHNSLKLHKLHHKGERPFKCTVPNCGKTYLSSSHLKGHIAAVHCAEKKYACPVCNKRFPYEHSLKMHMHLHTEHREFMCCICSKGFITRAALKNHEALHVADKLYKCQYCEKTYKTPGLLRGHERRHTSDRSRYMCDICGCTFMYKSNLEVHSLVHKDAKTFHCKSCDKSFKTYATLYSHAKVHQLDKPFMCELCGKGFKTKECLKTHTHRHSGEKPYKCALCKSCFPDKGGLSKHMNTVHASKPNFQCPACKKTCSRADNLRVHMKSHNDPALLKLSREDLMIEKPGEEGSSVPTVFYSTELAEDLEQVVVQQQSAANIPTIQLQQDQQQLQHQHQQQQQQQPQTINIAVSDVGNHYMQMMPMTGLVQTVQTVQTTPTDLSSAAAAATVGQNGLMLAAGYSHSMYMMDPSEVGQAPPPTPQSAPHVMPTYHQ